MLDVRAVRERSFLGSPPFRYAELQGTGNKDRDHSSWYSFDDEQHLRDRWWRPAAGDTVLDVGAAYGSYALPALALGARVVCFSPADFDTELLELNLSLNPDLARRCLVLRDGLYSRDGYFDPDHCTFAATPVRDAADHDTGQWLRVRSLDSLLEERPGIERVDWMKLDVEGAELEVLRGAEKALRMYRPRILVENHEFQKPGIEHAVRDYVLGLGLGYQIDGPHQHCAVSHSFLEVK
jgi:FkbM family methyltransferase